MVVMQKLTRTAIAAQKPMQSTHDMTGSRHLGFAWRGMIPLRIVIRQHALLERDPPEKPAFIVADHSF
jgi:hypothetical protein